MEPVVPSNVVEPSESIESAEPTELYEPSELIEPAEPYEPSELSERIESIEPTERSDNVIATNIDFPQNYSGVLYIQIIIYEQPNSNSDITLGLHELNQMIMT